MNKLLNIISIIFGLTLIICGILKLVGMLSSFILIGGNVSLAIPTNSNLIFILFVNFIGGYSMFYHAYKTLFFKKEILTKTSSSYSSNLKNTSKLVNISGLITLIVSFWFTLKFIVLLSQILNHTKLTILVVLLFGTLAILPFVLVAQNILLNTKIHQTIEKRKIAAFHARKSTKIKRHLK